MEPSQLRKALIVALKAAAVPTRAPQMQSYMKSDMPYLGVAAPQLKAITRTLFKDLTFVSRREWQEAVLAIWNGAKFREERYSAIQLTSHRSGRAFQIPSTLKLYEKMIVSGAWWDYVDSLASHEVGSLVRAYPKELKPIMLKWSTCPNLWKRRTAILCQLSAKEDLDLPFLYKCIEPSIESPEFFLRKGIGWALRQVAWRDPKAIIRYVQENHTRLSPLSQREALKNL